LSVSGSGLLCSEALIRRLGRCNRVRAHWNDLDKLTH
jgi:hypothetical protein